MDPKHALELIEESELFDADWYRNTYADVDLSGLSPAWHYLVCGGHVGRAASPQFCGHRYLAKNPDVAELQVNPLVHFLRFGRGEGRTAPPVDPAHVDLRRAAKPATPASQANGTPSVEALQSQLDETQRLLEYYFNRCETLEHRLRDQNQ